MKKKILPFLAIMALFGVLACAEEVVPTEVSLDTELVIELDDERGHGEEEQDKGEDPDID